MRQAGDSFHRARLRALIVLLWRAGLRINEALTVTEHDLDAPLGAMLIRRGKGGRRREVAMDPWGWEHLRPWLEPRLRLPVGPLLCVIDGQTRGRPWASDAARAQLRRVAAVAGVRRRFAPHQFRHTHAVELAHEGVPLNVIQRQLGHTNLGAPARPARATCRACRRRARRSAAPASTSACTAPTTYSRPGKLTRQGSPQLRWALYEAAQSACKPEAPTTATTSSSRRAGYRTPGRR
jgi:integrase